MSGQSGSDVHDGSNLDPAKEKLRLEYEEVGRNLRHYGNVQFTQLALFLTMTAALLGVLFKGGPPSPTSVVLKVVGALVSVLFGAVLYSATHIWHKFATRAAEIERKLHYAQFIRLWDAPRFRCRPGSFAILAIAGMVFLVWVVLIVCPHLLPLAKSGGI